MPEVQPLRPDHAPALLAFERANRAYFAASVPDRGDDYFARFAERATGRGLVTWAVRELCARAAEVYGLTFLTAASRVENLASRAVPARAGFTVVGEARLSGLPGLTFRRALTDAR